MALYATKDDLRELTTLVRDLLGNVSTLDTSVGELDTLVERINHLATLKDVTITYITEGDILQYSSDGTWHNISPALLAEYISSEGGIIDTAVVQALIRSEGSKYFLSKLYDDTAAGVITFQNGLKSNGMAYFYEGLEVGHFIEGMVGGSGARIDKDGRAEVQSLIVREFLEVPELRFNKIDVVSGELWNSIAYGTIESVDTVNQIATVKLEEGEYSGLHVNDICRGIFHNFDGVNNTQTGVDECGFDRVQGFSTAYFTPIEILDSYGKQFRYALKPNTTQHPTPSMKFAVYGNFLDETRQASSYSTGEYKRYLKGVNTWEIQWQNIVSQFGKLDGLTIPGAPNDGHLEGYGAYLDNVYMTGVIAQFKKEMEDILKGQDAYSVNITNTTLSVIVDNQLNILDQYSQLDNLTFAVQAFKGATELEYSDTYILGGFMITYNAVGVRCTMQNGVFQITQILNTKDMHIDILINCEGETTFKKTVTIGYSLQANGVWSTYNDNDNIPDRPTGDGTTNGWHRNYTASAIWMSTKNSIRVEDTVDAAGNPIEWSDPNRFRGASVAGKDGEYTVFAYTEASVRPPTPTGSTRPPVDPLGIYTWYMDPPQGDVEARIYVWQTTATVYSDKSMSGWSTPFRLTGSDGRDGTDGSDIEFVYKLTNNSTPPDLPANSNKDDYTEESNGWYDNPRGVSEAQQYEWVAQRVKLPAKAGTGTWDNWEGPTLWAKWGEKGMDGDGYEYIYFRTNSESDKPDTPRATNNEDEQYPKATIGGVAANVFNSSYGAYWTDDPQGTREDMMFEWVSTRKKTNGVWSNFSSPAIWGKWGETGLSGGNFQYRYKISATKPSIPKDDAASGWSTDGELVPGTGQYVWQILRFKNPDGTYAKFDHPSGGQTIWTGLIRLTGADGKDGEDGNSIEFVYTRNNDANANIPAPATNQITDWTGTSNGYTWTDNPQGVDDTHRYEWVSQRYLDKSTQRWGAYSKPGIWSVFADKGKDGDGYEYIYSTFSNYNSCSLVDKGETYYPACPGSGSNYVSGDYQADDHVPTKTCKGSSRTYTDNPENVNSSVPYQICWTRKKKNGVWGDWSDGFIWTKWAEDGKDGQDGATGPQGPAGSNGSDGQDSISYQMTGYPASIRSRLSYLQTTSVTLKANKLVGTRTSTEYANVYWAVYYLNVAGLWVQICRTGSDNDHPNAATSSFTASWSSSLSATKFWFGYSTDSADRTSLSPTSGYKTCGIEVPVVYDGEKGDAGDGANAEFTIMRDRGYWNASTTYYNAAATTAMTSSEYSVFPNYSNMKVVDYVTYKGNVYLCKASSTTGSTPSSSSSYWTLANRMEVLTVNNLLANNAQLGEFNFSNNTFVSSNGILSMNSSTGALYCTNATISGNITTNKLIATNSSGDKIASVNEFNDGAYIQYYASGNKRMEFNAGNITYYNDDSGNTVKWVLGENGTIDKSRWYWGATKEYYNYYRGYSWPGTANVGQTNILSSSFDGLFVTTDLGTTATSYKTKVRQFYATTGNTYESYNGKLAVTPSDSLTPTAATWMPDGLYLDCGPLDIAIPVIDPLTRAAAPVGGSGGSWYGRQAYWVSGGKITRKGQMQWQGTPSDAQQIPNDRKFLNTWEAL